MKRFAICIVAIIVWALGVASCSSKADSKASTSTAMPTFHLRLYPYSKTQATKKYLSLQAVQVHGVAF